MTVKVGYRDINVGTRFEAMVYWTWNEQTGLVEIYLQYDVEDLNPLDINAWLCACELHMHDKTIVADKMVEYAERMHTFLYERRGGLKFLPTDIEDLTAALNVLGRLVSSIIDTKG